jgi:ribose transport system ATP-binding protein
MATKAVPIIRLDKIGKEFGAVRALSGVNLSCHGGECLGLVGQNGAGKSTLMHILAGTLKPDGGSILVGGHDATPGYDVVGAQAQGVRCIFQELSLCPNLTVAENTYVLHAGLAGVGWRRRAGALIGGKLDEIFPGHGIRPGDLIGDLSIARRQMVEIARAFTETDTPVRLVILDEPTSSLDSHLTGQLLAFIRSFAARGGTCVFISHLLGEILSTASRIVVMRDGRVIEDRPASAFTRDGLVAAMGSVADGGEGEGPDRSALSKRAGDAPVVRQRPPTQVGGPAIEAWRGEVVGLAGLGGQGQSEMLRHVFQASNGKGSRAGTAAFVAGDRQREGIFPLWSIGRNVSIGTLRSMLRGWLIDPKREAALAGEWRSRIAIRTPDIDNNILSLSGGNQQKALFARALASAASIVLMDDPMRGVDIGTKQEVYRMIRAEADKGRTFLWYTTEMDELKHCDHVYVFRSGAIVAGLASGEMSEEKVLHSSFSEGARA